MTDDVEALAQEQLEDAVRRMFHFTGWDMDVDDDAAAAVNEVEQALKRLDTVRAVKRLAFRCTTPPTGDGQCAK